MVKIINFLSEVLTYCALGVVAVLMLLTVADVTGRYLFNYPIVGTTEITEYLMVCMLLAMAPCALKGQHVRIDLVMQFLPQKVQFILDIIFHIAALFTVAMLTWTSFKQSLTVLKYGAMSSMLKIPDFPFITVLVVSYAILFLAFGILLIQRIGEVVKK